MYYKKITDPTLPKDEFGRPDLDNPFSLRLDRLRQDLENASMGKQVEIPRYDFKTGTLKEDTGNILQLPQKSVLIIEGVFGLHPIFLDALSGVPCFKILTTPASGVRLDNLHIIPERKLRLLRSVARGANQRTEAPALLANVLKKFPAVAMGEQANMFAFAKSADAVFDSALHYELGVLKTVTLGSLMVAEKSFERGMDSSPEAELARELLGYFSWTEAFATDFTVLPTSVLMEFVGKSIFE
jgi:uridine kinase